MLILMTYQASSQFEANFDDRAGGNYTISYFAGEPVVVTPTGTMRKVKRTLSGEAFPTPGDEG